MKYEEPTKRRAIQKAIQKFSDPDVYQAVMLASSPEAAKKIVESLPGVRELVEAGTDAGGSVADLLQKEEVLTNKLLTSIALYLAGRIPTAETQTALARLIISRRFRGINSQLAAEVFLTSSGIDVGKQDLVSTALREARKFEARKTGGPRR
jgi:hypothetical protein